MKKLIATILIAALVISILSGCGNSSPESSETSAQAEVKDADTYYETGRNCLYGLDGQEIDYNAAYTNFESSLEQGKTEANFYLGLLNQWYAYPETDFEKAKAYYEAVEENPYAQLALGFMYYWGGARRGARY